MCQINDADYIAMYSSPECCNDIYGYIPGDNSKHPNSWTATGAQFQVPYVFKSLFSKEELEFSDLCETKEVKTALYLDMNENLPDVTEWERLKKLRKTNDSEWSKRDTEFANGYSHLSDEQLDAKIAKGHSYRFIGKVGLFCPIKPGCGGGILYAKREDKYYAATGSSGYRWLESEVVKELGKEDDIDISYYDTLAQNAIDTISKYGDFNEFANEN